MSHPVLLYTYYTLAYTGKASFLAWLSYIGMDKQEKFRLLDFLTPEVSCGIKTHLPRILFMLRAKGSEGDFIITPYISFIHVLRGER